MGTKINYGLNAKLLLEDGTVFIGYGLGFPCRAVGESVFTTGMVGYPESLTDPSYRGQILCFTYPLIGNYGVPDLVSRDEFGLPIGFESDSLQISGMVVQEFCEKPSHWACKISLDAWLKEGRIAGIHGIDTRELTKKLRLHGVMMSILDVSKDPAPDKILLDMLKASRRYEVTNFVDAVSVKHPIEYGANYRDVVVLIDCGVKLSIIRELLRRELKVIRVPYNVSIQEILKYNPKGVVLSNGPGDPKHCIATIKTVKELFREDVPMLGICLGTQIIALALGADTFKMKYGHRGQNKPCVDLNRSYVTSQNHGYAVDPESLKGTGLRTWFVNADDKTVEGIKHENGRCISVQFHPEVSPGPYDTTFVFDEFHKILGAVRSK